MKKTLSLILLALLPIVANAYDAKIDGIYYNFNGDEAEVTYENYLSASYSGVVEIPKLVTYNGKTYRVTSIGDYAFYGCTELTTAVIQFGDSLVYNENLVVNGDFSYGNEGFTSDYEYVSEKGFSIVSDEDNTLWGEGKYAVGVSPHDYHRNFIEHGDHTTGTGNMLIVNGSLDNTYYVWKQYVLVEKGKTYEFSVWYMQAVPDNTFKEDIEYTINEKNILGAYDKTENEWERYYGRYTATESGEIEIKIRTLSEIRSGNDFAIDDISFSAMSAYSDSNASGGARIGNSAFYGCSGLTSIIIQGNVSSIGNRAFAKCPELTSFYCNSILVPNIQDDTFEDSNINNARLLVPLGSMNLYKTISPWNNFGTISAIAHKYRYYNLIITDVQGAEVIQFSEFDLLDESLNEIASLNVYAGTEGFDGENWPNVIDNDVHTKYCSSISGNTYFLFDAMSQIEPYGYRFYTASDTPNHPDRNPCSWKLYGSNTKLTHPGDPDWVFIDERRDDMTMQATNYTPYDFFIRDVTNKLTLSKHSIILLLDEELQLQVKDRFNFIQDMTLQWTSTNEAVAIVNDQGLIVATGLGEADIIVTSVEDETMRDVCTVKVEADLPGHRYYQFAIEAIGGGETVQLSEFDLIDKNGNEVTPITTYAYTGSSYSDSESQEKLFDDDIHTKYCGPFSSGTTLYIYIDAGKKVTLSGYRMTTCNDTRRNPERNPVSWSLLGSNTQSEQPYDAVWTLLNHRENDNTLGAQVYTPYDFFFTYPQQYYVISDETTSINVNAKGNDCLVELSHNFNGEWESLYLPFAIDFDVIKADFDLAEIDGVVQNDDNNDGIADITVLSIMGFKGQMTEPNTPYLIRAKNAGEQTITFDNVTVYPTEEATFDCSSFSTRYDFTGSYNALEATSLRNRYVIQDGELVKDAASLAPCRWYMTATARNGAALNLPNKIRIMMVEDVIDGVSSLDEIEERNIYDIQARKLNKPQKGINIIRYSDGTTRKVLKK